MHTVSETWARLIADRGHRKEVKLVIAGEEYGEADIESGSLRVYGGLYPDFGIGNCCARQIEFTINPKGDIPRQAKVEVYVRLVLGDEVSEWLKKGVFFFSTRKTDRVSGWLSVHGYDAMLKSDEVWLDESYSEDNFPMAVRAAVTDIAARMGVTVDSRTAFNTSFPVAYPADDAGDMTMREVLARVAVANAGNWVISDEGELLLVPLVSAPEATHYLITNDGRPITIGGQRILV